MSIKKRNRLCQIGPKSVTWKQKSRSLSVRSLAVPIKETRASKRAEKVVQWDKGELAKGVLLLGFSGVMALGVALMAVGIIVEAALVFIEYFNYIA